VLEHLHVDLEASGQHLRDLLALRLQEVPQARLQPRPSLDPRPLHLEDCSDLIMRHHKEVCLVLCLHLHLHRVALELKPRRLEAVALELPLFQPLVWGRPSELRHQHRQTSLVRAQHQLQGHSAPRGLARQQQAPLGVRVRLHHPLDFLECWHQLQPLVFSVLHHFLLLFQVAEAQRFSLIKSQIGRMETDRTELQM
jgi:hypothetical protein